MNTINKIGILYHPMVEATQVKAGEISGFLEARGISVWSCSSWELEPAAALADDTDLLLTVGGDGTIMRAVQMAVPQGIPITGINMGKLGFMTELSAGEALGKLPELLDGKGWLDARAMLEVTLSAANGEPQLFHALNDAVVARGEIARVIRIEVSVNDEMVTSYTADGVIVATATGSTGYALAAGGPVLYPQSEDFILLPVAPHLSLNYTLVLPADATVTLQISTVHQATLSIDGHLNLPLASGDIIEIKRCHQKAAFLRIHPEGSFFGSLEQKLKGNR